MNNYFTAFVFTTFTCNSGIVLIEIITYYYSLAYPAPQMGL